MMTLETRDKVLDALKRSLEGALTIAGVLLDEMCARETGTEDDREASHRANAEIFLTVKEAAAFLKVTERTIYEWDAQAKIPTRRVGGELRFLREELLAWTAANAKEVREQNRSSRRTKFRVAG